MFDAELLLPNNKRFDEQRKSANLESCDEEFARDTGICTLYSEPYTLLLLDLGGERGMINGEWREFLPLQNTSRQ